MKIKTVKYILSVLLTIFAFTSCDKNELAISEIQKNTKTDILTFATQEDFDKTLAKVNAMTKEERLAWEKQQGFKSFGTICDEFYATIQPENFKSLEEVKAFVSKNSDKIELYTSSDGETYCEPKDYNGLFRNISGINEMFIIGDKAYKVVENKLVSSSLKNIDELKKCTKITFVENSAVFEIQPTVESGSSNIFKVSNAIDNSAYKEGTIKIGSDNYKLKLYLRTTSYRNVSDPRNQSPYLSFYYAFRRTESRQINYARWMMIWWVKRYNSQISGTISTNDSYNASQSLTIVTQTGPCDDSEYKQICDDKYTYIDPNNNSTSYFVNYNITAKNTEKDLTVQLTK